MISDQKLNQNSPLNQIGNKHLPHDIVRIKLDCGDATANVYEQDGYWKLICFLRSNKNKQVFTLRKVTELDKSIDVKTSIIL